MGAAGTGLPHYLTYLKVMADSIEYREAGRITGVYWQRVRNLRDLELMSAVGRYWGLKQTIFARSEPCILPRRSHVFVSEPASSFF
jgi:hypothetical protein